MIARISVSFVTGVAVTFLLLLLMQTLIAFGEKAIVDEVDISLGDFIRVKKEEVVNKDEDDPEPPPEVEEPPPEMPDIQTDDVDTSQSINISGPRGKFELNTGGFVMGDGEYLPIVKVAPIYPRRAAQRGLEGQCLIEFTVTETGTVKDAFVVECTSNLFASASIKAAEKFKYKPRVIDGVPQEVKGVQHIITFKMEQ